MGTDRVRSNARTDGREPVLNERGAGEPRFVGRNIGTDMHGRAAIPWNHSSGPIPTEASGCARGAGFAIEALRLVSRLQALRDVSQDYPVDFSACP